MNWSIKRAVNIEILQGDALRLIQEIGKPEADKPMLFELKKMLDAATEFIDSE